MAHECIQEETIGKIKEFIQGAKSLNMVLGSMASAILIQICTFLFLWGSLTTTVKQNTEYLWKELNPTVKQNTRDLDKLISKLDVLETVKKAIVVSEDSLETNKTPRLH